MIILLVIGISSSTTPQSQELSPVFHVDIDGLLSMDHDEKWAMEIAKLQNGRNLGYTEVSDVELIELEGRSVWKVNATYSTGNQGTWFVYVDTKTGASKKVGKLNL